MPPLHDDRPTSAQLKCDIESGRTGEQEPGGAIPRLRRLGRTTQAEGRSPSPARTALARHYENIGRWLGGGSPLRSSVIERVVPLSDAFLHRIRQPTGIQ